MIEKCGWGNGWSVVDGVLGVGFASSHHLEFDSPAGVSVKGAGSYLACPGLGVPCLNQCWFFHVAFCLLWQLFQMYLLKINSSAVLQCIVQVISYLSFDYLDKWYAGGERFLLFKVIWLSGSMCLHRLTVTGSILGRALEIPVTFKWKKFPYWESPNLKSL